MGGALVPLGNRYYGRVLPHSRNGLGGEKSAKGKLPDKDNIMKYQKYALIALAAVLTASCNKEKVAIEDAKDATQNSIEIRKDEVEADAKAATERTEANAEIDKANIQADKESMQAQLDAEKKKAEADADAAKAKVDAEN